MSTKKLFILANSIKKHHRCIAGREVVKSPDGNEYWAGWVRPVTRHDEGAIYQSEYLLQDSSIPAPFDVIEIPFSGIENSSTQPENWFILQGAQWSKISRWSSAEAQLLIETPKNLWLQPGVKQDRVTPQYLLSQESHQSLYLIKPVDFRLFIEVSTNWEGIEKKKRRGVFCYNRQWYNFSMTDPLISQKYFPTFPNHPSGTLELERKDDLIICVSLTPELKGYHYKILASIIEL